MLFPSAFVSMYANFFTSTAFKTSAIFLFISSVSMLSYLE